MRYTVAGGVTHQSSAKLDDSLRYVLPLVAVLLAAIYLGLHQSANSHKSQKPLTLGIYTVKTGDGPSSPTSNKGTSGSGSIPSPTFNQMATAAPSNNTGSGLLPASGPTSGSGLVSSTNPQGSSGLTVTLQTPGLSVGPISTTPATLTVDPPLPKTSLP